MTEPTEADYAASRSLLDGWPFVDNEHAYYADIGTCTLYQAIACKIATARAEERERCAKIADKYAAEVLPVDPGGVARIIAGRIRSGA
jgi:hypothetical protein